MPAMNVHKCLQDPTLIIYLPVRVKTMTRSHNIFENSLQKCNKSASTTNMKT